MPPAADRAPDNDRVSILLGLFNGAAHLAEQLDSIAAQDHPHWALLASDDGSTDASRSIVEAFAARHPDHAIHCLPGPACGFAANFLSLVRRMPADPGWLAFCDQDDIWLPDRLSRGLAALRAGDPATPALYCSRTWVCTETMARLRLSPPRPRAPGFRNALVQNIAAGNTILLNPAAARLLRASADAVETVVAHDWWAYLLVSGAGGRVVHDDTPTLLYRQHPENLIGANDGTRARLTRIGMILDGQFHRWNSINLAALAACSDLLSAENRAHATAFERLRRAALPLRLAGLARLRLYRQTGISTLALWFAAALKRL